MDAKVTISKQTYRTLKQQAAAWRHVIGGAGSRVVFNAVRDNRGQGVEAGVLAKSFGFS